MGAPEQRQRMPVHVRLLLRVLAPDQRDLHSVVSDTANRNLKPRRSRRRQQDPEKKRRKTCNGSVDRRRERNEGSVLRDRCSP